MYSLLQLITLLNIGFTIVSAIILLTVYLCALKGISKTPIAIFSCAGLLLCLCCLQVGHLQYVLTQKPLLELEWYRFWLFLAPVFFYFFSRVIILPEAKWPFWMALHFSLPGLNYLFRPEISVPLLFLAGLAYSSWIAHLVYGMREQRSRFRFEIFFFVLFWILAVFVLVLGITLPYIDQGVFYLFYANCLGLSFILITGALLAFPDLLVEISEVARINYASTTLNKIDIDDRLNRLEKLMSEAELYKNENLNLALLAEAMELSGHQLSELVNSRMGTSFSRYLREVRIRAAQKMLLTEPEASILSISMATGFKTQSNFYTAFNEIAGVSPGAYRKTRL